MRGRIQGLSSLKQKFDKYPALVVAGIRKAMESAAQDMVNMAQTLVAKGDSGELEEAIGWTWGEAPQGAMILGSVKGKGAGSLTITVYAGNSEAFYARWVEFGTAKHSTAKGGGTVKGKAALSSGGGIAHPGAAAQPFFYVSYRANRKKAVAKIRAATARAGKKAATL